MQRYFGEADEGISRANIVRLYVLFTNHKCAKTCRWVPIPSHECESGYDDATNLEGNNCQAFFDSLHGELDL